MLHSVLAFVKNELDKHLVNQFNLDESVVILNSLADLKGDSLSENTNQVILTLINIERESAKQFYGGRQRLESQQSGQVTIPLHLNADVLATANYTDYAESLKFVSQVLSFFQSHLVFNAQNSPDLPAGVDMLQIELESMDYYQTHNLWSSLGARYQPSVVYKIRHITVNPDQLSSTAPDVIRATQDVLPS